MAPWTPTGDKWPQMAMVLVARDIGQGWYSVAVGDNGAGYQVPATMLHAMPSAITAEQEAVLEAAEKWRDLHGETSAGSKRCDELTAAVDALPKSLAPVDKVAEVKAAMAEWESSRTADANGDAIRRLRAAIAALEAKS
ncbi:MAG TPA: hypothetical protein VN702_17755 [Acetobacteraceae bacterium]|nr:hypothetical protein [Acetobacteraceae bacterium]